jgi:D-glycero-D-manno-heptose 1,7-bisphosphate phosphatase
MLKKAIFLDRDGVINQAIVREGKPYPPTRLKDVVILQGVKETLERLHKAGYSLIVVTNQPDVSRGKVTRQQVDEINNYLLSNLIIDEILTCFHDDFENCNCRKPKPGLLIEASKSKGIDLAESYMIGDRWRDIECGQNAGCKTIFINYHYQEKQPVGFNFETTSLKEACVFILGE